jgi:hypothetical protein
MIRFALVVGALSVLSCGGAEDPAASSGAGGEAGSGGQAGNGGQAGSGAGGDAGSTAVEDDPHAYFDTLVGRADFWKGYSLRPRAGEPFSATLTSRPTDVADHPDDGKKPYYERQLHRAAEGGYTGSNSLPINVTYDPATDGHPEHQDAAKVSLPLFVTTVNGGSESALTNAIGPGDTAIIVSPHGSAPVGRQLKIGSEIVVITGADSSSVTPRKTYISRGQYGTSAQSHAAGTLVRYFSMSIQNQVRLPIYTQSGHTYLFAIDAYFPQETVNTGWDNHKFFQFSTANVTGSSNDVFWWESNVKYTGQTETNPDGFNPLTDVGTVAARAYDQTVINAPGTPYTQIQPVAPLTGRFALKPSVWTRWWFRVEHRPYPEVSDLDMWVADEARGPVQIYAGVPVTIQHSQGIGQDHVHKFWLELNSSGTRGTDELMALPGHALHYYLRNFAALRWPTSATPSDFSPFLQRPSGGSQ